MQLITQVRALLVFTCLLVASCARETPPKSTDESELVETATSADKYVLDSSEVERLTARAERDGAAAYKLSEHFRNVAIDDVSQAEADRWLIVAAELDDPAAMQDFVVTKGTSGEHCERARRLAKRLDRLVTDKAERQILGVDWTVADADERYDECLRKRGEVAGAL